MAVIFWRVEVKVKVGVRAQVRFAVRIPVGFRHRLGPVCTSWERVSNREGEESEWRQCRSQNEHAFLPRRTLLRDYLQNVDWADRKIHIVKQGLKQLRSLIKTYGKTSTTGRRVIVYTMKQMDASHTVPQQLPYLKRQLDISRTVRLAEKLHLLTTQRRHYHAFVTTVKTTWIICG